MRVFAVFAALVCAFAVATTASARPKVTVKTKYYDVRGKTGAEVLRQINRKGPRHGFLVRAIAQTQYTLSYGFESVQNEKDCRITKAEVKMDIVYVYPKLRGKVSRKLNNRWKRFLRGVRVHEEVHGKLAKQMASATEKALLATRVKGKRGCRKVRHIAKRNVDKVFKRYERKQVAFDKKEHRKKGNVENLVAALVKK
ncbi:MAG: DUF922 domain-containing protein [Rhizobiaceae bacterium]